MLSIPDNFGARKRTHNRRLRATLSLPEISRPVQLLVELGVGQF